jgi:hypothetical protein
MTKGRISQKAQTQKSGKSPKSVRARFGPPARFGHFFTEPHMFEEIEVEFHRVIVGLKRECRAVVKLSIFSSKIKSFVSFYLNF